MNKFIKGCFIAAGVFLAIGAIICFTCFLIGGKDVFAQAIEYTDNNTNITISNGNLKFFDSDKTKPSGLDGTKAAENVYQFKADDVEALKIDFGAGEFIVNESEDDNIYVCYDSEYKVDCKLNGNELYVGASSNKAKLLSAGKNTVIVSIPTNNNIETAEFSLGACECVINNLTAGKSVKFELGAGSLTVSKLNSDSLDINLGAGSVDLYSTNVNNADFEVGMGSISFEGDILNELDAECSMGSLDLYLARAKEEYSFDIDCSMGSVEIDNKEYAGFVSKNSNLDSGNTKMDLECSMGSICVDFAK